MRSTLLLLALACTPAYCQERANAALEGAAQGFSGPGPRSFSQVLRKQLLYNFHDPAAQSPQTVPASPILRVMGPRPATSVCSIPLAKAKPPGTPVAMPNMMPVTKVPRTNPEQSIDEMKIVVPAPACPVDFGKVSAPRTTP